MERADIAMLLMFVFFIILLFAVVYAYYKIDQLQMTVEVQVQDLHGRFSKLINAINAINFSEFQLDMEQQKQINKVSVEK